MICHLQCPELVLYLLRCNEGVHYQLVATLVLHFDAEIMGLSVYQYLVAGNPAPFLEGIILAYQENVGCRDKLPVWEIWQEIWLVGGKGHSKSQYFRISGSEVCITAALRLSPMFVTGRLEHRKNPESK